MIRSASADWTIGSSITGLTVATKRLVSVTWLCVHTASTDAGTPTQPRTSRTAAATDAHRIRRRRTEDAARRVATSLTQAFKLTALILVEP